MANIREGCRRWPRWWGVVLLVMGALVTPVAAQSTYNVSTVAELRAALATVNAGQGGDLIVLAPGFYALTSSLQVRVDVSILGDPSTPAVLDGGGVTSILSITAENVSIRNLTLQNAITAIGYEGNGVFSGAGLTISGSTRGLTPGDSGGNTFISNSTIVDNEQEGITIACAELHLRNVTVANNGVGIYLDFPCGEQMEITNSLIVGNGVDCRVRGYFSPVGDASFDGDGSCAAGGFGPGLSTADPAAVGLAGLAANGGPTMTEEIPGTSVAVNAGGAACPATDQRGFLRNVGPCDIGAYEVGAAPGGANTQTGANVTVSPAPGVTVTFAQVTAQGDTTATTGGPPPPTGFQVDGVVYDIVTTSQFAGPVTVCLPYSSSIDPSPLLFHYENLPPPTWVNTTTSVDPVGHIVCGTAWSLSPFAVMIAGPGAGAGDVGDTLSIAPAGGGDITLSWTASCAANDTDYSVYEGTIGNWYSHVSRLCSTAGATSAILTPQPANAYYLIVPRNAAFEGIYGKASSGADIPQGGNACTAQQVGSACP
jgi:hypothetical protein